MCNFDAWPKVYRKAWGRSMKNSILTAISGVLSLCVAGCASAPYVKSSQLEDIKNGNLGAIVFGAETDGFKCGPIILSFREKNGGHVESVFINNPLFGAKNKPNSIAVPPGDYVMSRGSCRNITKKGGWEDVKTYTFPATHTSFEPISVAAGESVYVGTFKFQRQVDMSKYPSKLTLKLVVLGLNEDEISVVDYQVDNDILRHKEGLQKSFPDLVPNLQVRIAQVARGYVPLQYAWDTQSKRIVEPKVVKPLSREDAPNKTVIKEKVKRTYTKPPTPPVRPAPRTRPTRPTVTPPTYKRPTRPTRPAPRPRPPRGN